MRKQRRAARGSVTDWDQYKGDVVKNRRQKKT